MLRRKREYENPLFYPHAAGDKVVNLLTAESGIILAVSNKGPQVKIQYDNLNVNTEDIRDIANLGCVEK